MPSLRFAVPIFLVMLPVVRRREKAVSRQALALCFTLYAGSRLHPARAHPSHSEDQGPIVPESHRFTIYNPDGSVWRYAREGPYFEWMAANAHRDPHGGDDCELGSWRLDDPEGHWIEVGPDPSYCEANGFAVKWWGFESKDIEEFTAEPEIKET